MKMMRGLNEVKDKASRLHSHLAEGPAQQLAQSSDEASLDHPGMRMEPGMRGENESKAKDTHRQIIEVAERLFRQLGFQKTTVADIARELRMSPANVYRFFSAKSEINAAVCKDLLGSIETEADKIARSRGTSAQKIRDLIASVEKSHYKRFMYDRKLHELIEAAVTESWSIVNEHNQRMTGILEQIISSGMAAGELRAGDAALAARLVSTACIRFCHPRLMVEYDQKPEPTLDQMINFCLSALAPPAAA
jgi:AcrR family transcriptional regulator